MDIPRQTKNDLKFLKSLGVVTPRKPHNSDTENYNRWLTAIDRLAFLFCELEIENEEKENAEFVELLLTTTPAERTRFPVDRNR